MRNNMIVAANDMMDKTRTGMATTSAFCGMAKGTLS
jgi:hypothetical protein